MAYQQPPGYSAYPPGQQQQYPPGQQQQYPPGPGYQPPAPGYQPAPAQPYGAQQQSSTNVVVVQQQPREVRTTTYVQDDRPNHLLHCIITFFCPWWIFIWLIVCCVYGC